jgi:hypothetical protein
MLLTTTHATRKNEDSDAISVVGVGGSNSGPATNKQDKEEGSEDDETGGDFLLEEADPLFHGSTLNEVEEKEPLVVLELTAEQRAAANRFYLGFPNGNGITEV